MFEILPPARFVTSPWKNGGGITHEVARREDAKGWLWRISIAEVSSNGPFSRFEGLSRVLTVIEGNGVDLLTPDGVLSARFLQPVAFSGDLPVESRMVDGPIRDLNVIFDASRLVAQVRVINAAARFSVDAGATGLLCLAAGVFVDGVPVRRGSFALGNRGQIVFETGAVGVLVTLREIG